MLKAAGVDVYFGDAAPGMIRVSDSSKECDVDADGFCVSSQCPPVSTPEETQLMWLNFDTPTSMAKDSGEDGKSLTADGTFNVGIGEGRGNANEEGWEPDMICDSTVLEQL